MTESIKNQEDTIVQEDTNLQTEDVKAPELNLNDLADMRNLIEVVTQRGVFKATELSAAGQLFDKLNTFLNAAEAQAKANQLAQGE